MKNLIHFMKLAWSVSPSYILLLVVNALLGSAKTLLNIVLPMYLIDELTGEHISPLCCYITDISINQELS